MKTCALLRCTSPGSYITGQGHISALMGRGPLPQYTSPASYTHLGNISTPMDLPRLPHYTFHVISGSAHTLDDILKGILKQDNLS